MNTVYLTNEKVFIMKDDGEIIKANECSLDYKGGAINFIERDGLYGYSEFFSEGDWPEEYYVGEKADEYDGLRLKMVQGGWYSMNDLIKILNSELMKDWRERTETSLFEETDDSEFDNKLTQALESLKKMRDNDVSHEESHEESHEVEYDKYVEEWANSENQVLEDLDGEYEEDKSADDPFPEDEDDKSYKTYNHHKLYKTYF